MGSAAVILWSAVVGVVFGWQPMSDGSPRYEYIVQLEPEVVAQLAAGQAIPLTTDIPPEIGPIGRIRIVVGREDLPRQQLATSFQPWPKTPARAAAGKLAREGLVETQYTQSGNQPLTGQPSAGADRYGNATNSLGAILPPAADERARPLAQSPPREVSEQIADRGVPPGPRRGGQILPPEGTPGAVQAEARQLFSSQDRVPDNFSQAAGSVQQPASGVSILPAGNSNSPAVAARDETNRAATSAQTILPPSAASGLADTPRPPRLDRPIASSQVGRWQESAQSPSASPAGPPASAEPADPPENFSPAWPPTQRPQQPAAEPSGVASWPAEPPQTPTIRREMFQQPADAPLQTAAAESAEPTTTLPPPPQPPSFPQQQQPVRPAPWAAQPPAAQHSAANHAVADNRAGNLQENGRQENVAVFPLVLAWVLLSGSGAGNLYLFWSYFDVRSKYQELVQQANRRPSPQPRDYD